ncbi:DYN1 [Candida metapsilosis]|uniref:Dynein heavy chain, cytoplasmic n=1 Tax=Candida metapsilosis TaxID=273372 RepID=A0A8H7ZCF6_9ASCO|nr:DYN1 [Candida metapsilosis]
MAPSMEDSGLSLALYDHIIEIVKSIDGESATLQENHSSIQDFLNNHDPDTLLITKERGHNQHMIYNTTPAIKSRIDEIESIVFVIKPKGSLVSDKPFGSQLNIMNIPVTSNTGDTNELSVDALKTALELGLLPYYDLISSERDSNLARKRFHDLLLALQTTRSISIPNLLVTTHPKIKSIVAGETDISQDLFGDVAFINELTSISNDWINQVQSITKAVHSTLDSKSLKNEIQFWNTIDLALKSIDKQIKAPEITTTLELLSKARKFHVTLSFENDIGLKEMSTTAASYESFFKDIPLDELLDNETPGYDSFNSALYDVIHHINQRLSMLPVSAGANIIQLLLVDVSKKLQKLISKQEIMSLGYSSFMNHQTKVTKLIESLKDKIKFTTTTLRELARKRQDKVKPISIDQSELESLASRLHTSTTFRANHESLMHSVEAVLHGDEKSKSVKDLIEAYNKYIIPINVADISHEGKLVWNMHENAYKQVFNSIFTNVVTKINGFFDKAQQFSDYLNIYRQFLPNIQSHNTSLMTIQDTYKLKILDQAMVEIQGVREDMGDDEDYTCERIIHDMGLISKLKFYRESLSVLLGTEWVNYSVGTKIDALTSNSIANLSPERKFAKWVAIDKALDPKSMGLVVKHTKKSEGIHSFELNMDLGKLQSFERALDLKNLGFAATFVLPYKKQIALHHMAVEIQNILYMIKRVFEIANKEGKRRLYGFISGDVYQLVPLMRQLSKLEWTHLSQAIDLVNRNDVLLMRSESLIEMQALNCLQSITQQLVQIDTQITRLRNFFVYMERSVNDLETVPFSATHISEILNKLQHKLDETSLETNTSVECLTSLVYCEVQACLYGRLHNELTSLYEAMSLKEPHESIENNASEFAVYSHSLALLDGLIVMSPPLKDGRRHFFSIVNSLVTISVDHEMRIGSDSEVDDTFNSTLCTKRDSANHILNILTEKIDQIYSDVESYLYKWRTVQNVLDAGLDDDMSWLFTDEDDITGWYKSLREVCEFGKVFDEPRVGFGGLVIIEAKQVVSKLSILYETFKRSVISQFSIKFAENVKSLELQIKTSQSNLNRRLNFDSNGRQLLLDLGYISEVHDKTREWKNSLSLFSSIEKFIFKHRFKFPREWLYITQLEIDFSKVLAILKEKLHLVEKNKDIVVSNVNSESLETSKSLKALCIDWTKSRPIGGDLKPAVALQCLNSFRSKFHDLTSFGELLNRVAKDMEMEQPFTHDVVEIMDDILHLREVWSSVNTLWEILQQMKLTLWKHFNTQDVSLKLREISDSIKELPFGIRQYQAVDDLREEIKRCLKVHPKLIQLNNSCLKERHWKKILDQLCPSSQKADHLTLGLVWQLNLDLNFQLVQDVLDQARDERTIEESLNKIEETWAGIYYELFNYENKCRLVKNWDALFDQCETDLEVINSIKKSLYYETFGKSVSEWEQKLNTLHSVLDIWVEVQREYIHLDGVLGKNNNEVRNLLPLEHSRFQNLSFEFVSLLKQIYKYDQVIDVLMIGDIQGQLNRFLSSLNRIQKSLAEYLEKQRDLFPRFFFLGDEDLLEVIGFSKDIMRINKHVKKMFGGVSKINFDQNSHSIVSVESEEGEVLTLTERISLVTYPMLHEWLIQLELQIQRTLMHSVGLNHAEWNRIIRNGTEDEVFKLLNETPGQVANLLTQIVYTSWIESSISSETVDIGTRTDELIVVFTRLLKRCSDLITQKKSQNLIIELLQQKQLIKTLGGATMEHKRALWVIQQKFYLNQSTLEVVMKQAFSSFAYGFEYMGIPEKLAYSPLLNNCFLNMTQALSMRLGGSPVGPSGTGKTESIKALGQSLGKMVVVFCCDERFDYSSMGRIFHGLCRVGAWGCFDEFNRLDEMSLSAISSQVETIQKGLQHPSESIELSHRFLQVNPDTALFVTMNPGYAGRNQLPENLKKLFRTFQMVKPDVQIIIEVLLTSMTFKFAQDLSKIVAQFFSEILFKVSNQKHYDFGLRAIKTTLSMCGNLKYKDTSEEEAVKVREYEIVKQSIHQTVLPKLISDDIEAFSTLQELCFPNVTILLGTAELRSHLGKVCDEMGYEASAETMEKAMQLASIQSSNHGIMLCGESGSGKSTVLKVTMKALMKLEGIEHTAIVISPKVFSKDHLYGKFDILTRQWTDGLFTSVLRRIQENSRGELGKRTWIVFDGDIDPIWAENLNSVLDDNRVLTLPTGERLVLPSCVSIVFETTNLDNATPATISRCGMIWFDKSSISNNELCTRLHFRLTYQNIRFDDENVQSKPQLTALVKELTGHISSMLTPNLIDSLDTFGSKLTHIMQYSCERAINTVEAYVRSYIRRSLRKGTSFELSSMSSKRFTGKVIILALVWAFAGDCSPEDQVLFAQELRSIETFAFLDFPEGPILDYEVRFPDAEWIPIESKVEVLDLQPQEITNPNIIVPTIDTIKHEDLIYAMIQERRALIMCGPPGSGKTMTLYKALSKSSHIDILPLNFSKETTPQALLKSMESSCEYRRVNGGVSLCPKTNGKWVVVFCDEINLPGLDKYGSQTVISLLRQMIEHNGFWRPKDMQWVTLRNIQFVGACNSPKDPGRYELSPSFLRHVCLVQVNYPGESSLLRVYQTLNNAIFKCAPNLKPFVNQLTRASIDVYEKSKAKFTNYVYSPRELTRWSRGLFEALKSVEYRDLAQFLRLWYNEGLRLFYDRLSTEQDRLWTLNTFHDVCSNHFPGVDLNACFKGPILFSDWMTSKYQSVSSQELKRFVKERLRVYSEEEIESELVLHEEMLDHILRIDRVLKQPQGHLILVGSSSSGRTTLSRFVSWMNGTKVVQLSVKTGYNIDDFDEFLRRLLLRVVDGERLCLIIDESSMVEASFIERMNVLLANAEVPGLFEGENHASLISKCVEKSQSQGLFLDSDSEISRWFTDQIAQNLHVVFTIGESQRGRSGQVLASPALFNRCVLSWMGNWSRFCLFNVASSVLSNLVLESSKSNQDVGGSMRDTSGSYQDLIIDYLIFVHENLDHLESAHESHSPGKFLSLLKTFASLCTQKRAEADERQRHIILGLEKLQETVIQVDKMKSFLTTKEKELAEKNLEARKMLDQMLVDQNEAERKQEFSIETQAELEKQEAKILSRKETVLKELAMAEPAVLEAQRGVQNIKKQHLSEIRSMTNPPAAVKMTVESVCVLLGYRVSSWRDVQLAIRGEDFIPNIVNFDCEQQLPTQLREYMEKTYLSRPDYTFEVAHRASKACGPLLEWVRAQLAYSSILTEVGPLREEVMILEQQTTKTRAHLIAIDQMIKELEVKIDQCKSDYSELIRETEKIRMESTKVSEKLQRSMALVKSLESERHRWKDSIKSFELENDQLIGTALLCASFVTYAGALDEMGRDRLLKMWRKCLSDYGITYDDGLSIADYLMRNADLQLWLENGLPNEEFCKINVSLLNSVEYPVVIDPTGAIVDIISKSFPAKMLTVTAFSNEGFLNSLENSLRFGGVIVIEDAEQYNPVINDLLRNTVHRNGGRMMIELGGELVDFNPKFKMIMCTKEPELELTEFVQSRTNVVNFSITSSGSLESRILDKALQVSHPELEKKRAELILAKSEITTHLQGLEDELLMSLSASTEGILEDDSLLATLETLKQNSMDLSERLENAKDVMSEVDKTRETFNIIASHCVSINSLLTSFEKFSWFYRIPLTGFMKLCFDVMKRGNWSDESEISFSMYRETFDVISPTLAFEDKMVLAMSLIIMWNNSKEESYKDGIRNMMQHFLTHEPLDANDIKSVLVEEGSTLSGAGADSILNALMESLNGQKIDLFESFSKFCSPLFDGFPFESKYSTTYWLEQVQLILVLTPDGFDATFKLVEVAEALNQRTMLVSMGAKESADIAYKSIERACKEPLWIVVQNVHLASAWLDRLKNAITGLNLHPGSKLLFTGNSQSKLPQLLAMECKILYFEKVTSFRGTVSETFAAIPTRLLTSPVHLHAFLLLSWFHCFVSEMCRYIPFSFKSEFEVNDSDLHCGVNVVENAILLSKGRAESIPWEEIRLMLGNAVYGGKISNPEDQAYLRNICNRIFTDDSLKSGFNLVENKLTLASKEVLHLPETSTVSEYKAWIDKLPTDIPLSWLELEQSVKQSMAVKSSENIIRKVLKLVDEI